MSKVLGAQVEVILLVGRFKLNCPAEVTDRFEVKAGILVKRTQQTMKLCGRFLLDGALTQVDRLLVLSAAFIRQCEIECRRVAVRLHSQGLFAAGYRLRVGAPWSEKQPEREVRFG